MDREQAYPVTWVVGDGRSGTTWLAELLADAYAQRLMFEPFHPLYVEATKPLSPYYYARPALPDPVLEELAVTIFTGQLTHPFVDRIDTYKRSGAVAAQGLVIKDVFANLLMKWAIGQFPTIKTIWLLRHPFAVALSKRKTSQYNWDWPAEPAALLTQAALYQDYLQPFAALIQRADSYFTKQVTLWAILNYIPLQQLRASEVLPVFYETLCLHPLAELKRIFAYLHAPSCAASHIQSGHPCALVASQSHQATADWAQLAAKVQPQLGQPSFTSRKDGTPGQYQKLLGVWRQQITAPEMEAGLAILHAFGLDTVYQDHELPLQKAEDLLSRMGQPHAWSGQNDQV